MNLLAPSVVVTDLDGTLLGPDKTVGEEDRRTIAALRGLGIPVVLATGRSPEGCLKLLPITGEDTVVIAANGGCCYDFGRKEMVFLTPMAMATAQRLLAWFWQSGVDFIIYARDLALASPGNLAQAAPYTRSSTLFPLTPDTRLEDFPNLAIYKFLATNAPQPQVLEALTQCFSPQELYICRSEATLIDLNPPGIHKGAGLARLAALRGFPMETVLAMGDGGNDAAMLSMVGMSAAPANAVPSVRAAVDFVTTPCGQNPLTVALRHFFPTLLPPCIK